MSFVVAGTNHKTSPLWLREKAALAGVSLFDVRRRLFCLPGIQELTVIVTCHRVEFYTAGPEAEVMEESLRSFLSCEYGLGAEERDRFFYFLREREAAEHLFLVMAGADSMVLGEAQVTGQVHRGFELARQENLLGPELSRLIQAGLETVKRVKAETTFTSGAVTLGSVAVEMARDRLGTLKNRAAMILGAGEMGIVTARALSTNGIATILVANRTIGRAQEVAHKLGGKAVDYSELEAQIEKVDVLVTATSAPHVILKRRLAEEIMGRRRQRPLVIIDLAVPRNVDETISGLPGVTLVNVDDLCAAAQQNTLERLAQLPQVHAIVQEEAAALLAGEKTGRMSLLDLAF